MPDTAHYMARCSEGRAGTCGAAKDPWKPRGKRTDILLCLQSKKPLTTRSHLRFRDASHLTSYALPAHQRG